MADEAYLFEIAFPGGTQRWTSDDGDIVIGANTWLARDFKYHDIPGTQDNRVQEDRFEIILLDDAAWTLRTLFRTKPLRLNVTVYRTEYANGAYGAPESGYTGRTAGLQSFTTPAGREVHTPLISPTAPSARSYGYHLTDEYQREQNANDNSLARTHIAQQGTWSGIKT